MKNWLLYVLLGGVLAGCQAPSQPEKVTLVAIPKSQVIAGASLQLDRLKEDPETGKIQLKFTLTEHELGAKTQHRRSEDWANSGKGQHIHLIVDGAPYMAHYQPELSLTLDTGSHVMVAFLARSYHESLKKPEAFVSGRFTSGADSGLNLEPITAPTIVYSRPKGTYEMDPDRPQPILLDFYLLNATLGDSTRLKVSLDEKVLMVDQWTPHEIKGLSEGDHQIRLQLTDTSGKPMAGANHDTGIRTFNIKYKTP